MGSEVTGQEGRLPGGLGAGLEAPPTFCVSSAWVTVELFWSSFFWTEPRPVWISDNLAPSLWAGPLLASASTTCSPQRQELVQQDAPPTCLSHLSLHLLQRLLDLLQEALELQRDGRCRVGELGLHLVHRGPEQSLVGTQLTVELLEAEDPTRLRQRC